MMKILNSISRGISNVFIWASGADNDILNLVPVERSKYFGIGGTIIFTALMASFAGGYAFFTAFKDGTLSIFFGLFWGALIFNLDRYIVSSFGVGDGKKTISKQEWIEASPRLLMAIVLGIVISTPLELKLFESEIRAEIARVNAIAIKEVEKSNSVTSNKLIVNYQSEILNLQRDVSTRDSTLQRMHRDYEIADEEQRKEWNGVGLTGHFGKGPMWEELKAKADFALNTYENKQKEYATLDNTAWTRIKELQQIVHRADSIKTIEIETNKGAQEANKGLLASLRALDTITSSNGFLRAAKWLITLLFMLIEIAPILFKMMTERGPYDDISDRIKYETKVRQMQLQSNLNQEINTEVKLHTDKYEQKLSVELQSNKDLMLAISKAQLEIAEVAIQAWKEEQKKKMAENPGSMINPDF